MPSGIHTPVSAELVIPTTKAAHPFIADKNELNLLLNGSGKRENQSSVNQANEEMRKQQQEQSRMKLKEVEQQQSDFE